MTNIQWERNKLQAEGLYMRPREEWLARESYTSERLCDSVAKGFFLHIALVNDPSDLLGTEDEVARNVERIGQSRFGAGMSYNALAFSSGRLYEGQPLTRRGTHTVNTFRRDRCPVHGGSMTGPQTSSGYNLNVNFRALCLPQQLDDPFTDEQLDSAARWAAAQIRCGLARQAARWHGHRCCTNKGCPGQRAFDRIDELQTLTDYYVEHGLEDEMAQYSEQLNEMDKKLDWLVDKGQRSARRERTTNNLLRRVRDLIKDQPTLEEIDALLADSDDTV